VGASLEGFAETCFFSIPVRGCRPVYSELLEVASTLSTSLALVVSGSGAGATGREVLCAAAGREVLCAGRAVGFRDEADDIDAWLGIRAETFVELLAGLSGP